jgi:hypothetical protein
MAWYRTGTVSVTNNNATVTGSGTSWVGNVEVGEGFWGPDGKLYEITAVNSATSLTISPNYLGTTQSGQTYWIAPTQSYLRDLAASASSLITTYSAALSNLTNGRGGDGTVSVPGYTFLNDQDTGMWRKGTNILAFSTAGAERVTIDASGNVLIGTTTNTHSSKLVSSGEISETVGGTQYRVLSEYDVGSGPAQVPIGQLLGSMAYQSEEAVNVGICDVDELRMDKTITASGTNGAQTINKPAGSVNFAAAATSLVVTNSLVTTSSVIIATVATNDTTMKSVAAVAAAGSFTLHANAAATAATRVNFIVIN